MATTYGAPTDLDLSACNVTATGGSTVQTLADLGKAVADNATAVATAQTAAATAQTDAATASATAATAQTNATAAAASASTALATANTAQTTAVAAQAKANAALPTAMAGVPNGYVYLDANGQANIKAGTDNRTATLSFNYAATGTNPQSRFIFNMGSGNTPGQFWFINDSDGETAFTLAGLYRLRPSNDGSCDLGAASWAWNNVYSKTAVQVTSDANLKTVIGSLGDATYTDGQKLASALFGLDTTMFQLNAAIAAKGAANARLHAGFIAQNVEAAITAAGLDPSKYALWTNSPVSETTEVDTGAKDADGNPITELVSTLKKDASGNQVYTQMLRYDQILCVLFEACKAKIAAQDTALASLTARVAALEAKSAAPATGSAS